MDPRAQAIAETVKEGLAKDPFGYGLFLLQAAPIVAGIVLVFGVAALAQAAAETVIADAQAAEQ